MTIMWLPFTAKLERDVRVSWYVRTCYTGANSKTHKRLWTSMVKLEPETRRWCIYFCFVFSFKLWILSFCLEMLITRFSFKSPHWYRQVCYYHDSNIIVKCVSNLSSPGRYKSTKPTSPPRLFFCGGSAQVPIHFFSGLCPISIFPIHFSFREYI